VAGRRDGVLPGVGSRLRGRRGRRAGSVGVGGLGRRRFGQPCEGC
jgi:hypothetical protein